MLIIGKILIMPFLNLIRWKNLIIILLTEIIIKYALIDFFLSSAGFEYRMSGILFLLLVLSSIFIAAAGYIINDIEDIEIDKFNDNEKPLVKGNISIKTAKFLLYAFNIIGVILSLGSAVIIKNPSLASLQLLIMALLYGYSISYKCKKIIGNVIIALTTASVPFLIWIYTIYDVLGKSIMFTYDLRWMHISISFYILFAFILNWIRELIKDKEDTEADKSRNCTTWAASTKTSSFKGLVIVLMIIFSIVLVGYQLIFPISIYYRGSFISILIIMLFFGLPLIAKANNSEDYYKLSNIIKLIMLLGLLTPILLWL